MITVDLRGHIQPLDSRTHIDRINDWKGSDSYVEGARRDRGDTPMPTGPKLPYILTVKAWHEDRLLPAGSRVEVHASQVGAHHQRIPGIEYPDEARPPRSGPPRQLRVSDDGLAPAWPDDDEIEVEATSPRSGKAGKKATEGAP